MTGIPRGLRGGAIRLIVGVAAAYVVVTLLGQLGARAAILSFPLGPGLIFALGLLLGPVVAWGGAAGYVVIELLMRTFGPTTAIGYLSPFVLVVTARRVWGAFGPLSDGSHPGVRTFRTGVECLLVAATTAVVLAASTSLGAVLLAESPFAAVVFDRFRESLLSMLIVGVPVLYAMAPVVDSAGLRGESDRAGERRRTIPTGVQVAVVGALWCIGGYGVSLVFHDVGLMSQHLLVNQLGRAVLPVLAVAGPDGIYLQTVVGGSLAAVTAVLLVRD